MDGKVPWDGVTGQSIPEDSSTFELFIYNPINSFFLGQFGWDHPSLRTSLVAQMRIYLQCGRPGFTPWVGKISWRKKWQSTPVLLPAEFHGQRSLAGYRPWGWKELDRIEWLISFHPSLNKGNCQLNKRGSRVSYSVSQSSSYSFGVHTHFNHKGVCDFLWPLFLGFSSSPGTVNEAGSEYSWIAWRQYLLDTTKTPFQLDNS